MNERITIRVTAEMKEALECFHQDQVVAVRSRQDVFRRIIEDWLIGHGYLQAQSNMQEGTRLRAARPPRPSVVAPPLGPRPFT
jgi:hypothetical protein